MKSIINPSGFLAQEVDSIAKSIGYDFSGVEPLVKAVQEQQALIESQRMQILDLEMRLKALESLIGKQ